MVYPLILRETFPHPPFGRDRRGIMYAHFCRGRACSFGLTFYLPLVAASLSPPLVFF